MLYKEDAIRIDTDLYGTKTYIFLCQDCKNELRIRKCYFKTHSKKCISCVKKKRSYESIYNGFIYHTTKVKNYNCNIKYEDFLNYTKIKKCHYCEKIIEWTEFQIKTKYNNQCYFLDRKNNDLGYTKENCVVCCTECNYFKGNRFTYEEFMLLSPILKEIRINRVKKVTT